MKKELHLHVLRGCAPTPLAHYLKALGTLRIVATQADANVRGAWKDGVFVLATSLSEGELSSLFLRDYAPTPLLSPWNGGSGFYPGDNVVGFAAIENSKGQRFAAYREAIVSGKILVEGLDERPSGDAKAALLRKCLRSSQNAGYPWLRAAFSLDGDGEPTFPALLGTGGNDGRLDFTNNYMQRLVALFDVETGLPRPGCESMLRLCLFREVSSGLEDRPIGQFFPGAAGGANGTSGFDAASLINPWDFVLMLEGALVLRVAALRHLNSSDAVKGAAPFALHAQSAGYASAASTDVSARGEQWMPTWAGAASFAEVSALFDEGRLSGGRQAARSTIEASKALSSLGVARGVTSFVRFGYFERQGQSNLAVPIGAFEVRHQPQARLLDELEMFRRSLSMACAKDGAPLSLARSLRSLERAMLAASLPLARSETWLELVCVLGEIEQRFATHGRFTKSVGLRPLRLRSAGWLNAVDDDEVETRLAFAIASQNHPKLGPIRANALPLDGPHFDVFETTAESLAKSPSLVWRGNDLVDDLLGVAQRRVIDGIKTGVGALPLVGRRFASLADIAAFLRGGLNEEKISRLARGLFALDWESVSKSMPERDGQPDALLGLVQIAHLPHAFEGLQPRLDSTVLRHLIAGRLSSAVRLLVERLVASGLRPKLTRAVGDYRFARRLGACVAIPICDRDRRRLLACITKPFAQEI